MCGTTRYENLQDLTRLPWFGVRDGRLVVTDPSVGPIIDMHTHLAMAFVRPMQLDLSVLHEETEHYLHKDRAIDMDVYINKNFVGDDLKRVKRDLTLGSLGKKGMRRTHTVPNLAREMADLGIVHSVLLPIDFPILSSNATTVLHAIEGKPSFTSFASVHPYASSVEKKLDRQVALGAKGIKMHPNIQAVAPENKRALRIYRMCAERKLPILMHCGPVGFEPKYGQRLTQVARYEAPIRDNPDATFVLAHAGALQWDQALELAKRYPNVTLELASQGLVAMRAMLDDGPEDRIVFGTDWPWYHQAIGLAKVLIATEGRPALRRKVLHDNAARLLS
jgi:uncharacterized protein